ncbi:hypothetical protein ARTHRO9AX_180321 [Arthrobacter sp. 9AX]|nr:hypothetical protein ARTHRO9AX_180321 [Arthrobacter sp. 9AX]
MAGQAPCWPSRTAGFPNDTAPILLTLACDGRFWLESSGGQLVIPGCLYRVPLLLGARSRGFPAHAQQNTALIEAPGLGIDPVRHPCQRRNGSPGTRRCQP